MAISYQVELRGDSERAGDIKSSAGGGDIADRAVDRAAAELDRSGLQHPLSGCNPLLVHRAIILQKPRDRKLVSG